MLNRLRAVGDGHAHLISAGLEAFDGDAGHHGAARIPYHADDAGLSAPRPLERPPGRQAEAGMAESASCSHHPSFSLGATAPRRTAGLSVAPVTALSTPCAASSMTPAARGPFPGRSAKMRCAACSPSPSFFSFVILRGGLRTHKYRRQCGLHRRELDRSRQPALGAHLVDRPDTDGYLWLTDAGVVRFDGVRFVPLDTLSCSRPRPTGTR